MTPDRLTPLDAVFLVAAVLALLLVAAGLRAVVRLGRANARVGELLGERTVLRSELHSAWEQLGDARRERDAALDQLDTLRAGPARLAAVAGRRAGPTKPLPRFARHEPITRIDTREG